MTYVGEMQYLTIGDSTYSLPTGGGGGGSVTSVGLNNATNGGLTIGGTNPVTSSGTITVGHTNVLTSAQSTSAVYPITIDKNGHIASYGSAVTIPTITLNGSASTSPSFYAPTSAGTSGYVLISSGSGAPGWTSATLTDTKVTQTDNSTESTNRMLLMSDRAPSNNTTHDGGAKTSSYLYFQPSTGKLAAGYNTHNAVEIQPTLMKFHYSDNGANYVLSLQIPDLSVVSDPSPTITLPNKTGIIALTSDIPTVPTNVSAFTNDAGYTTNTGTVTSVGISNATNGGLNISGSPITSSGTITIGLDTAYGDTKNPYGSKTANYVLAGPTSGSAAAPSFRALVAADIPDLSGTYSTTDEKVKVESASATTTTYYPILATGSDTSTRKYHNQFTVKYTSTTDPKKFQIQLGNGLGVQGLISLSNAGSSGGHTTIQTGASSATTLTLPSSTGTIALTSEIPTVPTNVSAFNNDAGYVTTDEKLKVTEQTTDDRLYPVLTTNSTDASTKVRLATDDRFYVDAGYDTTALGIGNSSYPGQLDLYSSQNLTTIHPSTGTSTRTITLPDATGTVALTSDITVSDVTLNGSSIVSSGVAAITDLSGNMSIDGTLSIATNNIGAINQKNSAGTYRQLIAYMSNNNLAIGSSAQTNDYALASSGTGGHVLLYGYNTIFYTGTSGSTTRSGYIDESGNWNCADGDLRVKLATTEALYTAISTAGWTSAVIV